MVKKKKIIVKAKKETPVVSDDVIKTINMDGIEVQDALVK